MTVAPRNRTPWRPLCAVSLVVLVLGLVTRARADEADATCFECHGDASMGVPVVLEAPFSVSAHAELGCATCHEEASEVPHPENMQRVDCAMCHDDAVATYLESDHGRALAAGKSVPQACAACHGDLHATIPSSLPESNVHRSRVASTCGTCHGDPEVMRSANVSERRALDTYSLSVHGQASQAGNGSAAVCSDCHGHHDILSAANPRSLVHRSNIPNTCGTCHADVQASYAASVHGRAAAGGIKESPVCTDCHGEHTIRAVTDPASSVYAGAITKTCASCHASERINAKFNMAPDRLGTFADSYHGLAGRLGDFEAANCASCHGWHDVLPSSDPKSWVNPTNLANTCGQCHPGTQLVNYQGRIHGGTPADTNAWIRFVKAFYLALIPLVIGGMLVHNLVDWLRKLRHPSPPFDAHELDVLRLNRNERLQHGLLALTFITLAYSGFVLKFPEAWWATPIHWLGGEMLRRNLHRWTGLVFTLLSLYHVGYLAFTHRGRELMTKNLRPRLRDLAHPVQLFLFNMGWRSSKPHLGYPSYIEKAEYWALVWGSLIMVLTGGLLVFHDFVLGRLPLWVSDLATMIHFYEAILACLAILVWHGYWVIFDPDVYPMNWAWLSGRIRRNKERS